ncbi:MAG TPA: hypothetical protein PLB59_04770 [Bacteroidales bacterium]|jgi:hypothetical protein|nr:hypothetical protein [Bacteroidales bacterium]HNZ42197.1 hypothetical protein [Bacteroidales bacterium]HPB24723.1 hypothetical protein [Bacteroidales bacterium]HPI30268.1 hypothetical protein [Bacteroidales bacterium]HQN15443.1 hypothetical protein [Bacteroidales bacterium]
MRKSLLLINLLAVVFIVFACRNSKEPKQEATTTNAIINKTDSNPDTSKIHRTSTPGSAGIGQGIQNNTEDNQGKAKAIIHPAPNKAEIDSIKNLKTKNKR